jgi:hypothetical protein
MRTEEEIRADALPGSPFSNMTGFEVWAFHNCEAGNGCLHDSTWGGAPQNPEVLCPLITVSLLEKTPREWLHGGGDPTAVGDCTAYEEDDGSGTVDDHQSPPPPPDYHIVIEQEGLF